MTNRSGTCPPLLCYNRRVKKRRSRGARGANGRAGRNGRAAAKKSALAVEIVGVLLVILALFALISVASYDAKDPSFATAPPAEYRVRNFAGSVGAYFSQALLWSIGLAAFFLPFVLGYAALRAVLRGTSAHLLKRLGTIALGLLIVCPFLALIFESFPFGDSAVPAGGIVGGLMLDFLVRYLSTVGSFILLLGALAAFLLFSTHWSLAKTLRFAKGAFDSTAKDVRIKVTDYQKTKAKDRMREKVRQKYAPPAPAGSGPVDEKAGRRAEKERERERRRQEREAARNPFKRPLPPPPKPKPAAPPKPEPLLFPDLGRKGDYHYPLFTLLEPGKPAEKIDQNELFDKKRKIEEKLKEFGIEGEVREYHPGPVITTYEYFPAPGIKVAQVANLTEDLALALETESVRIQRIPGKSSLGVEIPNDRREMIKFRDIIESEKFQSSPSKLTFALGKDVHGGVAVTDLAVMPHLLIAGSTGTGKSVALNALIASILYKATPEEVKIVLIDPKRLEFTLYEDIPHLLCPVINDPKKAHVVLMDIVRKMEERYKKLQAVKVRNIDQYNTQMRQLIAERKGGLTDEEKEALQPLPFIVIIIDELSELMMVGAQEVEFFIGRLAQLARAVGIHLVMATQRPSIDVITGTIKNNFSCRIAFRVPSKVDSRIIIDTGGADKLLGMGDMLFLPPNFPRLVRLHCSFISIPEVRRLVKHVKSQGTPTYDTRILHVVRGDADHIMQDDGEKDELYDKAVDTILQSGQASASHLQRRLKLGYARAARIIDQMEGEGLIGPSEGSKPREILVDRKEFFKEKARRRAEDGGGGAAD
jgi:S-DNA-T family DNA segregation ATPase FtsK/SpoIIIE